MLRKPSARVASLGVTHAKLAVEEELGWLFREQPTEDYGIDAQVEVVDGETVRGKLLAVQIKSGISFFREPTPGGWWFRPYSKHVRYWMNHSLPVAVILFHPQTNHCYWQLVNANTLAQTARGGWKLLIPKNHILDRNAHTPLREAAEGYPVVVRIRESAHQSGELIGELGPRDANDATPVKSELEHIAPITLDITPSPRLLDALTSVIAEPWTCIAEIVDTARHSTIYGGREPQELSVTITLPSSADASNNQLVVRDNGVGMRSESLLSAIRRGFTGAGSEREVSFFMMLLKLGRRFAIRTSQAGENSWIELSYDLLGADAFTARVCRIAKDELVEHGTEIIIDNLRNDQWTSQSDQHETIREKLSHCYSYLLREGKLAIVVNGQPIRPLRPCIWDAGRMVMSGNAQVSTVQDINHVLPTDWVCRSCGFQHRRAVDTCTECLAQDVIEHRRRIWGWLGIQRYLHHSDFGLDFLSDGRTILYKDKSLFTWIGPGDPFPVIEYPVEVPLAGRIVGEIHCDHVPVNFAKNAFDYNSREWQEVVETIRGKGPLGPARRKRLGYPANDSPLALLFTAFRRNDPGIRYLTPGDGQRAVHEKSRMWGARFHEGDPDFQTDEVWYKSALTHEKIKSVHIEKWL